METGMLQVQEHLQYLLSDDFLHMYKIIMMIQKAPLCQTSSPISALVKLQEHLASDKFLVMWTFLAVLEYH